MSTFLTAIFTGCCSILFYELFNKLIDKHKEKKEKESKQ